MYGSGLFYNRYRSAYDDSDRRHTVRSPGDSSWTYTSSPWAVRPSVATNTNTGTSPKTHLNNSSINKRLVNDYSMANSNQSNTPARRTRYSRSSTTTSVAQLLSDSCSSLLQKLTTRVRGPSATVERQLLNNNNASSRGHPNPLSTSKSTTVVPNFGNTRARLEDTYSNVLDRIYRRKDPEKTIEPSMGRNPLSKSSTTANVVLSEKAYPYVSNVAQREKTPFKNDSKTSIHRRHLPEPQYSYLDGDSSYRIRHRSNHSELRPRRSSKPHRTGKSEANERKATTSLKLCPVEIKLHEDPPVPVHSLPSETTSSKTKIDQTTSTNLLPDPICDREAKRKEIQSLIMKYSALDEAYNKVKQPNNSPSGTTSASTKSVNVQPATSASSVTASITQKYYPNLFAAVSSKKPCCVKPYTRAHVTNKKRVSLANFN